MNKKTKVVMITKDFDLNGISRVVSNYCDYLPADQYEIAILAGNPIVFKYQKKYSVNNIKIIECPSKTKDPIGYYQAIYKYLKENLPDIVHIHGSSAVITIELLIAWICGVKIRIIHSHNTSCNHLILHKLLLPICNIKGLSTWRFACSKDAGDWLFKKHSYTILPNAFNVKEFSFDFEKRDQIRKTLGVEDKVVLGHVGLFVPQKNHLFLLKILESKAKENENVILLLVGDGTDYELIQNSVPDNLKSRVIFYGETDDITGLLSAMDVFIFPSKWEGLPIAVLEAQISGLPCLLSDVISKEVNLGGDIQWLSINEAPSVWADCIHTVSVKTRKDFIKDHESTVSHFQIDNAINILKTIYSELQAQKNGNSNYL